MKRSLIRRFGIALFAAALAAIAARAEYHSFFPVPRIPFAPRHYTAFRAPSAPVIDGRLDDAAWQAAPWTEDFGDIEGALRPAPAYRTRARLLWDDQYLYIAAEMEEPNLWATMTQHDAVIYQENDFEVFIDPNGDTHQYYELEVNALGTTWDLLLVKPYRDGGPAVNAWEIAGMKSAVFCDGTLNDPADRDRGWTVELALPWRVLAECAGTVTPPTDGDTWRINFSRVEWALDNVNGVYAKRKAPGSTRDLPESDWTWSPQGLVNMHYPEMWGWVQFSTFKADAPEAAAVAFKPGADDTRIWSLRQVYYAEKESQGMRARFTDDRLELARLVRTLDPVRSTLAGDVVLPVSATVKLTQSGFEATVPSTGVNAVLHIREDGRAWLSNP
jgi:hypothetical protein